MSIKRIALMLGSLAAGIFAFSLFELWSARNAPIYKKFERQWAEDVELLESSHKLPEVWHNVKNITVIGGTPETKEWLRRIQIPVHASPQGQHRMEILVVAWEEDGKRGALVQYNIEDGKTKNNLFELGRTLMLPTRKKDQAFLQTLKDIAP